MSIQVTTADGTTQTPDANGVEWEVGSNGNLWILDRKGDAIATYANGTWVAIRKLAT